MSNRTVGFLVMLGCILVGVLLGMDITTHPQANTTAPAPNAGHTQSLENQEDDLESRYFAAGASLGFSCARVGGTTDDLAKICLYEKNGQTKRIGDWFDARKKGYEPAPH